MNPDQAWSLPPREHCTLASSCPLTPWGRFAGFLARPHHRHNHRIRNSGLTPASNLAELRLARLRCAGFDHHGSPSSAHLIRGPARGNIHGRTLCYPVSHLPRCPRCCGSRDWTVADPKLRPRVAPLAKYA